MDNEKNVPEIRFRGREGEWVRGVMINHFSVSSLLNRNNQFGKDDVLSVSREYGVINQIEYQGRSYAGVSVSGYGVVKQGDVVYTKSPLRDQPFGIIKANKGVNGIVSALYAVYKPNETIVPDFIQSYFESDERLNNYLRPIVHKGAKNTLNISDAGALTGSVNVPSIAEQKLLVSCFNKIDALIIGQKEKLARLRTLKAALLDKLFPAEGQTTPEIRVKGCEGEWKKVKASDVFANVSDKGHPQLAVLSASQEFGMIPREDTGIRMSYSLQNVINYKRVIPGQFVIHLRSFQGGFAHSAVEGITSPAYTVLDFKDKSAHYDLFWKFVLVSKEFITRLENVTYGIRDGKSIKYEDFADMEFVVPPYEEQCAIASLLTSYDRLIALSETRLTKLRQLKSSLLDKMFV